VTVGCPSCGAPVEFKAGSSVAVVCANCKFCVVRSDRDIRLVGKVADLAQTDSPLYLGLRGNFRGIGYAIVGRQQLDHGQGPWDEWYCAFDDGRWGWLAEAQGRYYFTFAVQPPPIPYDHAVLGHQINVNNQPFTVAEKGSGQFVTFDGELPVVGTPGEYFGYIDISGPNGTFGTLDYGQGSGYAPEAAYIGYVIPFPELGLPFDPAAKRLAAMAGGAGGGAEGTALKCPNCGGNLECKAPGATKRIACPYCNSMLDASSGPLKWLEVLEQQQTIPKIPIGSQGKIHTLVGEAVETGKEPVWTVIGYMTKACNVDGAWYYWDEYLLYEQTRGFRFLTEQNGHWSIVVPIEAGSVNVGQVFDDVARWRGMEFKKFSQVDATVTRVLGEFYWSVEIGEESEAREYVNPSKGLSLARELEHDEYGDREEINWSVCHYVEGKKLWEAFGLKTSPPGTYGVAPNQPNAAKQSAKAIGLMSLAFFIGWVVCFMMAVGSAQEKTVYEETIELPLPEEDPVKDAEDPDAKKEKPEPAFFSKKFKVPVGSNVQVEIVAEPLNNSFLWVGFALINEKTQEVFEMEAEASYYAGVTDGESWSEGSPRQTASVGGLTPGEYTLRIQPVMDTPANCSVSGTACPTSFKVKLKNDMAIIWPGILSLLLFLIVPIIALVRMGAFESRRWADSTTRPSSDD
jgi:hypothetical protein